MTKQILQRTLESYGNSDLDRQIADFTLERDVIDIRTIHLIENVGNRDGNMNNIHRYYSYIIYREKRKFTPILKIKKYIERFKFKIYKYQRRNKIYY